MKNTVPLVLIAIAILLIPLYIWISNDAKNFETEFEEQSAAVVESQEQYFRIGVVLHMVVKSGDLSTVRNEDHVRQLISGAATIWRQALVAFDVDVTAGALTPEEAGRVLIGDYSVFNELSPPDGKIHIYLVRSLDGINGIALGGGVALIADDTTVHDYRATAHEIGHLLGLEHTLDSPKRLMYQGANGEEMSEEEIAFIEEILTSAL